MRRAALALVSCALVSAAAARAQSSIVGPIDPLRFSQLKDFVAQRSSSNNSDPDSNDDSKRPIPRETVTLADLQGPGIVTHIWITEGGECEPVDVLEVTDVRQHWPVLQGAGPWVTCSARSS